MAQRVRFVAHVAGSPCGVPPLSAAANGTGQRTATVVGPKARAYRPAARAHPGCRTTCARADSPIDGVGLNPNERMPPPPPRPPPPANMCTETKWGKMLRLRSSQRGRTDGRTERRLVSASAPSAAAATPRACSRGLTCPERHRSGRRAGAAPPSVRPTAGVGR